MNSFRAHSGLIALLVIMVSCSQNFSSEEPAMAMAENGFKPVADVAIADVKEGLQALGPLGGEPPEGWIPQQPSSSMRVAQYGLPGPAGEATLGVFYFGPGQGGGLEANIERWYGQFSQPDGRPTSKTAKRWNKNVADIAITTVDISGTFAAGMGNEETRENYRMLGAIAVHKSRAVFFKLTGPFATIVQWEQSFNQFLDSLTASEKQTEKRVGGV